MGVLFKWFSLSIGKFLLTTILIFSGGLAKWNNPSPSPENFPSSTRKCSRNRNATLPPKKLEAKRRWWHPSPALPHVEPGLPWPWLSREGSRKVWTNIAGFGRGEVIFVRRFFGGKIQGSKFFGCYIKTTEKIPVHLWKMDDYWSHTVLFEEKMVPWLLFWLGLGYRKALVIWLLPGKLMRWMGSYDTQW